MPSVLGAGRGADVELLHGRVPAAIEVQIPESRFPQRDAADQDVVGILHEQVARAVNVEVLGVLVGLVAGQEGVPVGLAAALDGALARDAEVVGLGRVDQGRAPDLGMPFDAGRQRRIVVDVRRAQQDRALLKLQVDARLEEDRAREEAACGDDERAAALAGELVDGRLDGLRVPRHAVRNCPGLRNGKPRQGPLVGRVRRAADRRGEPRRQKASQRQVGKPARE